MIELLSSDQIELLTEVDSKLNELVRIIDGVADGATRRCIDAVLTTGICTVHLLLRDQEEMRGTVMVSVEKLQEAEYMLGFNSGWDKTQEILCELLESVGEGDADKV